MMNHAKSVDIGMVHGRFQPFHNGHLLYVQTALQSVKKLLIVGITNPSTTHNVADASDDHRHLKSANPFTFLERSLMVSRSVRVDLRHKGPAEVAIVPFDVNHTETWEWIPAEAVQFMNLLDPWDHAKREMFLSKRFEVVDIEIPRATSGEEIRKRRLKGLPYRHLVPSGSYSLLEQSVKRAASAT